ncbi:MAG: HAMP domain-containing histidine kinase [Nitrospirae bacterium]|nr:HAMP domain-containing histidine kinase [Nitrospirota bacterium]MBF0542322.1 HAMP domain-containing histidine kinase [Nitrospirota bacterium]
MKKDILTTGNQHFNDVRNINRDLIEKALEMRCNAYLAHVKAKLLTMTIYDVNSSKTALKREVAARTIIENQIKHKSAQLEELNTQLEKRVVEEVEKRRENELILAQQSKMAAMGEMLGAIAHQWRQPLNALGLYIQDIEEAYDFGELNKEYIHKAVTNSMNQIEFMSNTIDDFRNFFKSSKEKTDFNVIDSINEVLSIVTASLIKDKIELSIKFSDFNNFKIHSFANEFKHVILNIITNARDAINDARIIDSKMEYGRILITIDLLEDKHIKITIEDNGTGVPEKIIEQIFDPYFTSKHASVGTGIGLYMSKVIIEKNMRGKLYVNNIDHGARFIIEIPKAST